MKQLLRVNIITLLLLLTACDSYNEDTSSISTSTVESQQTSNSLETKVYNQITTTIPDELLGDWRINNQGRGLEVQDEKIVFYTGHSKVSSDSYYMDAENPMLLYARFSFEYAGVKYDQVSIEKTG